MNKKNLLQKISQALMLVLILFIATSVTAMAVIENDENVPKAFTDILEGDWGQTRGGTGGIEQCGTGSIKYNTAGHKWLSVAGDNDEYTVSINQGTPSVRLWLNTVANFCDRIISNTTGVVTDKSLKKTKFHATVATARFVNSSGSPINPGATPTVVTDQIVGPDNGLELNTNQAYFFNQRYVKGYNPGDNRAYPASSPIYREFSVNGLSTLAAQADPYNLEVNLTILGVNEFPFGGGNFWCTANGYDPVAKTYIPAGDMNGSSGRCQTENIKLRIKVQVDPRYNGQCAVRKINGITIGANDVVYMNPGESFNATFNVANTGSVDWTLDGANAVRLGTVGDVRYWGSESPPAPNAARIVMPGNPVGGNVLRSGRDTGEFTRNFTVSPTVSSGPKDFKWRILREGAITKIGTDCMKKIHIRENRPYITSSGGDVVSGAMFTNTGICNVPTGAARNAAVRTNGYPAVAPTASMGSSATQYAVFASGAIGGNEDESAIPNTFLGNYSYANRSGISNPQKKDALFANVIRLNKSFGYYYGDTEDESIAVTLPCINVKPSGSPNTSSDPLGAFLSAGSGYREVAGNVSIGATTVVSGQKTLVVNGTVIISGNITYQEPYALNAIPSLKIIADNIYIQQSATNIRGTYIAYDRVANAGIIDTCSTMVWQSASIGNVAAPGQWPADGQMATDSCNSKLVVNGSLFARNILWKRNKGTLGSNDTAANAECAFTTKAFVSGATVDSIIAKTQECSAELIERNGELIITNLKEQQMTLPSNTRELSPIY